jgi:hypothetical protein
MAALSFPRVAVAAARHLAVVETAAPPPSPAPVPVVNKASPSATAFVASAGNSSKRVGQVGGAVLLALGIAAAAYGGYLLLINGRTVCSAGETVNCTDRHVTGTAGAGFLVGGMGAVFAGSVLFYSFTW